MQKPQHVFFSYKKEQVIQNRTPLHSLSQQYGRT